MTITKTLTAENILNDAAHCSDALVLYGVSWEVYARLLDLTAGQTYPKLSYHNGVLKIMGKQGFLHENISRFLHDLIRLTSLILRRKVVAAGSMSLVSKRLRKGADPDESFYIQNADFAPRKKTLFDDETDTPPDLVIEVDESHKSADKFAIYADFGIKEFWLCDNSVLTVYALQADKTYLTIERSAALPILTTAILNEHLSRCRTEDQFGVLLDFEKRLREQAERETNS